MTKHFWTIYKKELNAYLFSPTGYIICGLFILTMALFLWVLPGQYNILNAGYASMDGLFFLAPILFLFLAPGLTMRLYPEEKQLGTFEALFTRPITTFDIVIGKALAAYILTLIALLPTLVWLYSLYWLADPVGNVDLAAFFGSFLGLGLLALVYISIGSWASAGASNPLIAFIYGAVVTFVLYYGMDLLSSLFTNGTTQYWIQQFGINAHYTSLSRGVIDSRDLIYFFGISLFFLFGTKIQLQRGH